MKKSQPYSFIIGSALTWGAVIVGCAFKLKGTQYYSAISPILIGGAAIHLVLIWGTIKGLSWKNKEEKEE